MLVDQDKLIAELQDRVLYLEAQRTAFFTGVPPENTDMETILVAQWGRKRLEQKHGVLLIGKSTKEFPSDRK